MLEVDIASIDVMTPLELLNRHLEKLNKKLIGDVSYLSSILIKKSFNAADTILCDDSEMLSKDFLRYLRHIQRNSNLLTVTNTHAFMPHYVFSKNFKKIRRKCIFEKTNPHAKVLTLISSLLESHNAQDIVVVSSPLAREKLHDDLEHFINYTVTLMDSSKKLLQQEMHSILLTTYEDIIPIESKVLILMDICFVTIEKIKEALGVCDGEVYLLYQNECENITLLRSLI